MNGPDGKHWPWGPIAKVHAIGDFEVVEFTWKTSGSMNGTRSFSPFLNRKDLCQCAPTLEGGAHHRHRPQGQGHSVDVRRGPPARSGRVMMHVLVGLALTAAGGFVSAFLSTRIRDGWSGWWGPVTAVLPMLGWTYLTRFSRLPLPLQTLTFEVVLVTATLVALFFYGFRPSWVQGAGILVATLGLAMLAKG